MIAPTVTLDELVAAVREGDPVPASDEELLAVAFAACDELRQRMPRYGFEQGDLDWSDAAGVSRMETAESAVGAVERMREAWLEGE